MSPDINATTMIQAINNLNNTLTSIYHTLWFIAFWIGLMLLFKKMSSNYYCFNTDYNCNNKKKKDVPKN